MSDNVDRSSTGFDAVPPTAAELETGPTLDELMRNHGRLRALAAASHAFATVATDYSVLLQKIASTTAELVGDGCLVTLLSAGGENLVNVASAHREPGLATDYIAYLAGREISSLQSASVSAAVARTGTSQLVHDVSPEVLVARTDEALKPVVARLNVHSFAVVPIRASGSILGTLSLFRSAAGRGYVADDLTLLQDIADRAGLAIENARLYTDLERLVRQRTAELEAVNKELEAFSFSAAHDLRAPLRVIDGFSQALQRELADTLTPKARDYLTRTRAASARMSQLIDALLELARTTQRELRRAEVDVSALARTLLERLHEAHPTRSVEVSVQAGLVARADPKLLEIALTNLLGNAWKFTGRQAAARIELSADTRRQPIVYVVRDNGAGFDPHFASRLFTVFQRMHPADEFEGTGVGLATVQRIIRRHGGRVWAEAELDRGASFYFTLEAE